MSSVYCLLPTACSTLLLQVKLEDVFKSTQQSMDQGPGSGRLFGLVLGMIAMVLLLLVLHNRRRNQAAPSAFNHHGKLMKEMLKSVPLKSAELKQLRKLAEAQSCSSPLVVLLCPSLLAKGVQTQDNDQRKALAGVVRRINS